MAIYYGDGTNSNSGRVIRIVQGVYSSKTTNTGISTWTNTPFPALTITPESTSSKILLSCSFDHGIAGSTSCAFRWTRGGTPIGTGEASFVTSAKNNDSWRVEVAHNFLDSPNNTSTLTYRLQFLPYDSGRTVYWCNTPSGAGVDDYRSYSTFQAMEIAG